MPVRMFRLKIRGLCRLGLLVTGFRVRRRLLLKLRLHFKTIPGPALDRLHFRTSPGPALDRLGGGGGGRRTQVEGRSSRRKCIS